MVRKWGIVHAWTPGSSSSSSSSSSSANGTSANVAAAAAGARMWLVFFLEGGHDEFSEKETRIAIKEALLKPGKKVWVLHRGKWVGGVLKEEKRQAGFSIRPFGVKLKAASRRGGGRLVWVPRIMLRVVDIEESGAASVRCEGTESEEIDDETESEGPPLKKKRKLQRRQQQDDDISDSSLRKRVAREVTEGPMRGGGVRKKPCAEKRCESGKEDGGDGVSTDAAGLKRQRRKKCSNCNDHHLEKEGEEKKEKEEEEEEEEGIRKTGGTAISTAPLTTSTTSAATTTTTATTATTATTTSSSKAGSAALEASQTPALGLNDFASASALLSISSSPLPSTKRSQDEADDVAATAQAEDFAAGDAVEWKFGAAWVSARIVAGAKEVPQQPCRKRTNRSVRRQAERGGGSTSAYKIRVLDDTAIVSLRRSMKAANNDKLILAGVAKKFLRRKRKQQREVNSRCERSRALS